MRVEHVLLKEDGKMARSSNPDHFTMVIERDPESGWLVGEVVELPGCYTQAPDMASLEKAIKESIEVYLESTDLESPLPDFVGTWRIDIPA
jgi:predicted RNase H-like HicB family nuclease